RNAGGRACRYMDVGPKSSPRGMRIAIIGSGVVGTATGTGLLRAGHDVVFCDVEDERVLLLQSSGYQAIRVLDLLALPGAAYLLSLPSLTINARVELSYVESASRPLGPALAMVWSLATYPQ